MRSVRSYWPIVLICIAVSVYVLAALQRLSPPVVALEVMRDLCLNPANMSLMFAMTMLAYGIMQPFSGFWADRFGPRRCLLIAALILGLGSLIFSQSQGLLLGLGSRTLIGLAAGLTIMPCMKLAMKWFSPARFGFLSACIVASAALSNFAVGRPLAMSVDFFGWRGSFAILGVLGLIIAVMVYFVVYDEPADARKITNNTHYTLSQEKISFFSCASQILSLPRFWLLGCLYGIIDMPYAAFTGLWVGPYLIEVHGQSELAVGNMLSLSAFGFLIGPPLWMLLAQYLRSFSKVIIFIAFIDLLLAYALVCGLPSSSPFILYTICIIGPVGGQIACIFLFLAKDLVPENISASAMGFINIFPIVFGAFMQKIIGSILSHIALKQPQLNAEAAYGQAFKPFFILMLIGLILAIYLMKFEKKGKITEFA